MLRLPLTCSDRTYWFLVIKISRLMVRSGQLLWQSHFEYFYSCTRVNVSEWNKMVVTLEEHLELSLAGRTDTFSWRYLEVNCGSCSLFPRDVKHTHFDFFGGGGGSEFGVEILLPVCQDHGRIMWLSCSWSGALFQLPDILVEVP